MFGHSVVHGMCARLSSMQGRKSNTSASLQDACDGYQYGMECLFRFFSYGLEKAFEPELYRDFEATTLQDYQSNPPRLYGLEKVHEFRKPESRPHGRLLPERTSDLHGVLASVPDSPS